MTNKPILYLGLSLKNFPRKEFADHYPVIQIIEKDEIKKHIKNLDRYTHIIFTSKTSVDLFFKHVKEVEQKCIAVGPFTHERLKCYLVESDYPKVHTQEGIIEYLQTLSLENASFFLPRSSIARKKIDRFLTMRKIPFTVCVLYDTVCQKIKPVPDLSKYREIVFTSPSTVKGFFQTFSKIPKGIKCTFIGPVTKKAWQSYLKKSDSYRGP